MQIKQIDPRALTPYGRNTKKHDQTQIDNVAESIRQFGFVQPVVVDKDNTIVIGHCRVLASIQLGMETVPCVAVDELTPEQVQALRIVDNKTNESPLDFAMLELELPQIDLGDFDFGDLGVIFQKPQSIIDILYNDDSSMTNIQSQEKDEFHISFSLPIEMKENVFSAIKKKGKQHYEGLIIQLFEDEEG